MVETKSASVEYSLQSVLHRIDALARLQDDWDTYGGASPTALAVRSARQLAQDVVKRYGGSAGKRSLPYHVAPIAHGGVGLEWRDGNASLEIWIGPDGSLGYLLSQGQDPSHCFEEAESATTEQVLRLLGQAVLR